MAKAKAKELVTRPSEPAKAKVKDSSGLLEGDYADGRRLATFYGAKDVSSNEKALRGFDCQMARTIAEIAAEKPSAWRA